MLRRCLGRRRFAWKWHKHKELSTQLLTFMVLHLAENLFWTLNGSQQIKHKKPTKDIKLTSDCSLGGLPRYCWAWSCPTWGLPRPKTKTMAKTQSEAQNETLFGWDMPAVKRQRKAFWKTFWLKCLDLGLVEFCIEKPLGWIFIIIISIRYKRFVWAFVCPFCWGAGIIRTQKPSKR